MFLDFKKWVKLIQTAGYNGARTVMKENFYPSYGNLTTHIAKAQSLKTEKNLNVDVKVVHIYFSL
jgi:hypothetical protein